MYSFQPGIDVNISMKKHNLTSRYSRYAGKTSKLSSNNRSSVNYGNSRYASYYQDSVTSRVYPPAVTGRSRQYFDVASNAATACTHLHSTTNNSPILFSKPRVDSKWIWQQDPLPKPSQPVSYSSRMQSPYVRKLETYHGEHRSLHHDYTAEELERINLKCKAWLESCTPWLP